jgi:penicillin-binding protein 1A
MFPKKWWQLLLLSLVAMGIALSALVVLAVVLIYPELPSLEALTDYNPKVPMRIYSEDGHLIAEFGEERRALVKFNDVPKELKQAILAAEDERFYQHGGIDTLGILRAAMANLSAGGAKEGASTITMQVARNFFLSGEKTFKRKLSEALLAIKIEHSLNKEQILELYINQIYLGQRSYGFAAAAHVYYGKPLDKLNTAEVAMLAGLPKAPSRYNPFANLKRATERQHYVLRRMHDIHFINDKQYELALEQPLRLRQSHRQTNDLSADYVAEIVRQTLYDRYQDDIYKSGLKVYTTIRKSSQEAANDAILQGILDYDRRHGYRGPEGFIELDSAGKQPLNAFLDDALDGIDVFRDLIPAVVLEASSKAVRVYRKDGGFTQIGGEGLKLALSALNEKTPPKQKLRPGALIRVRESQGQWYIAQAPQVEAALVAMDPQNGAVRALVGGFDFNRNKFNHVTQAWRQPGSSFKPFIYSAALEKGITAGSVINDEPLVVSALETGSGSAWEPHNFDGKFDGPIRMRTALTKSKNMVSIRILQSIGVGYAQDYITRFGFAAKDHPPYLAMALGAGSVTPWQMARAYAIFANGGYRVTPYLIDKIVDSNGKVIEQAKPLSAGGDAPHVIDPRNAFIMTSMMQDVVRIGTAAKASELGRYDLAGKTGTTNNFMDAWFAGYNPRQVAVAWIGFDQPRSLGKQETGGHAALPMWISYMSKALQGLPDEPYPVPEGVVSIKINPLTGARADEEGSGLNEFFYHEYTPPVLDTADMAPAKEAPAAKVGEESQVDQLF